jgi:hypothetical protein
MYTENDPKPFKVSKKSSDNKKPEKKPLSYREIMVCIYIYVCVYIHK